jgi:hypothetical protein
MDRAVEGAADLVTGEYCRFCPVKLQCPKLREEFDEMATASADVSDEALDSLFLKINSAKIAIKAIEARILARCQEGAKFSNVKMVRKRGSRMWKPGADEALIGRLGEEAWEKTLLSPAKAEKISPGLKAFVAEHAFLQEADGYTLAASSSSTPEASLADDISRQFAHY